MNLWEYFWLAVIIFSIVSFTYMSIKIVYKGFAEMKEMFESLNK
jgi:hypothetical protein